MKKVIVNADIMAMYKTLNSMKSRADLIAGDVDVFWANTMNLKTLKAQVDKISEVLMLKPLLATNHSLRQQVVQKQAIQVMAM